MTTTLAHLSHPTEARRLAPALIAAILLLAILLAEAVIVFGDASTLQRIGDVYFTT